MIICNPRSLAFALLIAALPVGFAFAGGDGRVVHWGPEWARRAWAARPLAAERRRGPLEVAPRRVK